MPGPWILTRPPDEAARDVAALAAAGVAALALPALERVALPWSAPRPDLVLLTSAGAVPAVREAWAGWSPAPRVAALRPETSARARAAGLPVDLEAAGGVVALAEAALAAWSSLGAPARTLLPTSEAGLASPEQQEAAARLRAHTELMRVAVFSLQTPTSLTNRLSLAPPGARWVFASPSAAAAVLASPPAAVPSTILCHGDSTERAVRDLLPPGWPAPVRARARTVVEAVLEIERQTPSLESP